MGMDISATLNADYPSANREEDIATEEINIQLLTVAKIKPLEVSMM